MDFNSKADKIKYLDKKLSGYKSELKETKQIRFDLTEQIKATKFKVNKIEKQLFNLVPKNLKLSDHAVVRYMERHQNINVEEIRKEILSKIENLDHDSIEKSGFLIKNNVISTYLIK